MAEPGSENGVRTGIVLSAGALTVGLWLAVGVRRPPLGGVEPSVPRSTSLTTADTVPATGANVGATTLPVPNWKWTLNPESSRGPASALRYGVTRCTGIPAAWMAFLMPVAV